MARGTALYRAMRDIAQSLTDADPLPVLTRLAEHATDALDAAGAGVMLLDERGRLSYATADDDLVEQVDVLQASAHEGPCWTCAQEVREVRSEDLLGEWRWPRFAQAAATGGLRAVTCFPLAAQGHCWGTLNVFYREAGPPGETRLAAGRELAAAAAAFLHNSGQLRRLRALTEQLEGALQSRVVIEQAKGKLSVLLDLSPDEAFEVLRRTARNRQQRLHELAGQVMADEAEIVP